MLHGDARHTARAGAVGPTRANLVWTSRLGAPIEAQVVASPDEQTLYVAALDGSLTALAAKDGARSWSLPLGDRAYSTPCVAPNGTVYVGSDAKRFYAVTPQPTGAVIAWQLETNGEADTGAVILHDGGDLVVFAAGASVYAVRAGGERRLALRGEEEGLHRTGDRARRGRAARRLRGARPSRLRPLLWPAPSSGASSSAPTSTAPRS